MKQLLCQPLLFCSLLSMAGIAAGATPLPAWQVLEYEQQAFFVTARSRVEIVPDAANAENWRLSANSSVASNSEELILDMVASSGRAVYRSRFSKGKNERYKTFDFQPEHILRVRRDTPPGNAGLPPAQWPISSSHDIPYPPLAAGVVVTDAYALLALAQRFLTSEEPTAEVVVYTEFNFYRVGMSRGDGPAIKVDYQVSGAPAVSGSRQTRLVTLQVTPVGEQREKPDFSLLGLDADVSVLFDRDNGLPLQLRGKAPRIGSTEINLKSVTMREPPA